MKVRVESGRLTPSALFKPVSVSFFIGQGLLGGTLFLLALLLMPPPVKDDLPIWVVVAFLPLAVLLQALVIGALVVFGAWLYSRFRPIEVVNASSKL
jgi:hypothetical protein